MQGTQLFQAGDSVTVRTYVQTDAGREKVIVAGRVAGINGRRGLVVVLANGDDTAHGHLFRRVRMATDGTPASIAGIQLEQLARGQDKAGRPEVASITRDAATLASVPAAQTDAALMATLGASMAAWDDKHPTPVYDDSESESDDSDDSESLEV